MPPQNPFASERIRPGAIAFVFDDYSNAAQLVERLRAHDWRGQIFGPHGSGKSTLLQSLLPALRQAGREICHVRFQGGKRLDDDTQPHRGSWHAATLVIIDGFEQLGRLAQWRWRFACRWRGCGLLVTAHRSVGLPALYETRVDNDLALRVVDELLAGDTRHISPADVAAALREQFGNLRDALFQLYDLYEERRRAARLS